MEWTRFKGKQKNQNPHLFAIFTHFKFAVIPVPKQNRISFVCLFMCLEIWLFFGFSVDLTFFFFLIKEDFSLSLPLKTYAFLSQNWNTGVRTLYWIKWIYSTLWDFRSKTVLRRMLFNTPTEGLLKKSAKET